MQSHFECFQETAEQVLVRLNLKHTQARARVLDLFRSIRDHLDAESVHRILNENTNTKEAIGLATVYRTLKRFEELGLIVGRDFGQGRVRYELQSNQHHSHEHIINTQSQEIIEFSDERLQVLLKTICKERGLDLVSQDVRLYVK